MGEHTNDPAAGVEKLRRNMVPKVLTLAWVMRQPMENSQLHWSYLFSMVSFLREQLEIIRQHRMEKYMTNREKTQTDTTV